jgi:hypothetical protein
MNMNMNPRGTRHPTRPDPSGLAQPGSLAACLAGWLTLVTMIVSIHRYIDTNIAPRGRWFRWIVNMIHEWEFSVGKPT